MSLFTVLFAGLIIQLLIETYNVHSLNLHTNEYGEFNDEFAMYSRIKRSTDSEDIDKPEGGIGKFFKNVGQKIMKMVRGSGNETFEDSAVTIPLHSTPLDSAVSAEVSKSTVVKKDTATAATVSTYHTTSVPLKPRTIWSPKPTTLTTSASTRTTISSTVPTTSTVASTVATSSKASKRSAKPETTVPYSETVVTSTISSSSEPTTLFTRHDPTTILRSENAITTHSTRHDPTTVSHSESTVTTHSTRHDLTTDPYSEITEDGTFVTKVAPKSATIIFPHRGGRRSVFETAYSHDDVPQRGRAGTEVQMITEETPSASEYTFTYFPEIELEDEDEDDSTRPTYSQREKELYKKFKIHKQKIAEVRRKLKKKRKSMRKGRSKRPKGGGKRKHK